MLNKYELKFNKKLEVDIIERLWYTPSVHQKAASTTADDIGKEKRKSDKQSNSKVIVNTKSNAANVSRSKKRSNPKPKKQQLSVAQSIVYKEQDSNDTVPKNKQKPKTKNSYIYTKILKSLKILRLLLNKNLSAKM